MTRPRRLKKICEAQGKPAWRDVDSVVWGARKYYSKSQTRNQGTIYPLFYYQCTSPSRDHYHHYHLTSSASHNSFPIYTEDHERQIDALEAELKAKGPDA